MKPGFQPVRRNRKIGTPAQGHGTSNTLTIPTSRHREQIWWEVTHQPVVQTIVVGSSTILFLIDPPFDGFQHALLPRDICNLLAQLPNQDWHGIGCFYLRQSTRKQRIISPTWGRISFWAQLGNGLTPDLYEGPAILLEAFNSENAIRWSRSLTLDDQVELDRLRQDGHRITEEKRSFRIEASLQAFRTTQLLRTIPHEIGHWVDWKQRVEIPSTDKSADYGALVDGYWSRPASEREAFAHRYADSFRRSLSKSAADSILNSVN